MTPVVVIALPDGTWLGIERDQLERARKLGAQLMRIPAPASTSTPTDDELLDAEDAAAILGVSVSTVQRQAKEGALPCVRVGRYRRFKRSELLDGAKPTDRVSASEAQRIE